MDRRADWRAEPSPARTVGRMDTPDGTADTETIQREVDKMVATYRSTVLSPEQVSRWLSRLKELVVASRPGSTKKATLYLAAGCRFLVDMAETGDESVDQLLCDATVARWSHQFGPHDRTPATLGNYLGALNRLVDTRKGLPTQRRVPSASAVGIAVPLTIDRVTEIFDAALTVDTSVAAAWVVGVGANRPARSGVGAVVASGGACVVVGSNPGVLHVVDAVVPLAARVAGVVVGDGCWLRLRAIAAEHGLMDLADVARVTHRVLALGENRSFVEAVRRHRLTFDNIDSARPHLRPANSADVASLLRGPR